MNKRSFTITDKDNNIFNIEAEIKTGEFSISGDAGGSCGQLVDSIKPANPEQEKLVEIWNKYHLNGMNAGTEKQSAAIEKGLAKHGLKYDYKLVLKLLRSQDNNGKTLDLLEVEKITDEVKKRAEVVRVAVDTVSIFESLIKRTFTLGSHGDVDQRDLSTQEKSILKQYGFKTVGVSRSQLKKVRNTLQSEIEGMQEKLDQAKLKTLLYDLHDGKVYKYGSAWLKRELPENFWNDFCALVDQLEFIEDAKHVDETPAADTLEHLERMNRIWDPSDALAVLGFAINQDLTIEQAEDDIEIEDNILTFGGIDYIVGNEEEVQEKAVEYIKESAWAFNAEFLAEFCGLPASVFKILSEQCEGANEAILEIIGRGDGIEYFAEEAVSADGRGHFLNSWDGIEEIEDISGTDIYIYRQ